MALPVGDLLELALGQMRDYAVILVDTGGRIVGWFGGAKDVLGYTYDEVKDQPIAILFTAEDVQKGVPEYEREVARRGSTAQDDRWHVRKDGSQIWVSGSVTPITGDSGALEGFVKVMRDRTDDRIKLEERANRLAASDAALARTNVFLRQLGHELRNPLSPIKNAAYILPHISSEPRVAELGKMIGNQALVIERLASDLMDVARFEQQRVHLDLADVDVCALLRDEAVAHSVDATRQGVRVELILPHRALVVPADPARLRQAVSNLLLNAIKYTPSGGTVWVKAVEEADEVAIRVEDTGIGIEPGMLQKIFELFTQESRAREAYPGGLGIGLAIVREIALLHGGVVQARSGGIGKGSEFTLRLPRNGQMDRNATDRMPESA
ncbi:MAG TPA: PAS domain-containing sensor histidine kinase [Ramlibacter sp.]|nr:PAS domain-containing sensor histidine kinase [Ramlibacter sp.]